MILAISTREEHLIDLFKLHTSEKNIEKFVLMNEFEYEYTRFGFVRNEWNYLISRINTANIPLDILNGGAYNIPTLHDTNHVFYKNVKNIHQWPYVFFLHTIYDMWRLSNDPLVKFDIKKYNGKSNEIYHTFISFNNKAQVHRCLMMDLFAKENLLNDNLISWHNLGINENFKFKYFDNRKLVIDDYDYYGSVKKEKYSTIPITYNNCLFEVVSETSEMYLFLTEKTATPIFLERPFIVYGCQGYHKWLSDMGFELYTELFDYSFDDEPDVNHRFELETENLIRLNKLSRSEQLGLYNSVVDKLKHNKELAIKYAFDRNHYPSIVNDIIDNRENYILVDWQLSDFIKYMESMHDYINQTL